jgi:hypothetical protein
LVEWLGPATGLVEPAGALAVELAPSVGAFVGPSSVADEDGSGCHPPQPSPIDGEGDGDGSSVGDVLGVEVGVCDCTGAEDAGDDGDVARRGLGGLALGLQVAAGYAVGEPDPNVLWVWLSVLPGPPLALPPEPELPPAEPADLELLGKIACCASKAT